MLDLDFSSGVVIAYRVGLAAQDCQRWKNRFLSDRILVLFCRSPRGSHFKCVIFTQFPCCDAHGVQFLLCACQYTSVFSAFESKGRLVSLIGCGLLFSQSDLKLSIQSLLFLPWKKSCQNIVWHKVADKNIKQTNKQTPPPSPPLSLAFCCTLNSFFRAFQRFQSCARLFPPRSTAPWVGAYLFLNVSSNVLVTCQLGRNGS